MKVVDANILLYVVNRDAAHHTPLKVWWEDLLSGDETVAIPWICLLAFVRLSTNPKVFSAPLVPEQAIAIVDTWLGHPLVHAVTEAKNHWQIFRSLVAESGAAGNLSTDASLAALAISHGAKLVSCDGDFARFAGLRWENPLA